MMEVSDEAICSGRRESQRVTPEIPLEGDDRERCHTGPNQTQGRLSPCKTGVQEAQARRHEEYHGRSHDDEGLVTWVKPLVDILGC